MGESSVQQNRDATGDTAKNVYGANHYADGLIIKVCLRDYFATQALAALISSPARRRVLDGVPSSDIPGLEAGLAYRFADAMMVERAVGQ